MAQQSARTRTRLSPASAATASSASPSSSASSQPPPGSPVVPSRGVVVSPDGPQGGCPVHGKKSQHGLATPTPASSRGVFTQSGTTNSALEHQTSLDTDQASATTTTTASSSSARVRSFDEMPGPKGYPIVGTLLEYFRKENHGRMHEIQVSLQYSR